MSDFLIAVENNDEDKVFKLLKNASQKSPDDKDALLNSKNQDGKPVLQIAVENGNPRMILFMLSFVGSKVGTITRQEFIDAGFKDSNRSKDIQNKFTAFDLARHYHHQKKGKKEEKTAMEIMQLLVNEHATISDEDKEKFNLIPYKELKDLLTHIDQVEHPELVDLFNSIEHFHTYASDKTLQGKNDQTSLLIKWNVVRYASELQKQAIIYIAEPNEKNKLAFDATMSDAKLAMNSFKSSGQKALGILKDIAHFFKAVVKIAGYTILAHFDAQKAKAGLAKVSLFRDGRNEEEKRLVGVEEKVMLPKKTLDSKK